MCIKKTETLTLLDRGKEQDPQYRLDIHDQSLYQLGLCL